jgi:hypothetical protein
VAAFDFDFEIYDLKGAQYKQLLHEEIMLYHSHDDYQQYLDNKHKYPNGMLAVKYADLSGKDNHESREKDLD